MSSSGTSGSTMGSQLAGPLGSLSSTSVPVGSSTTTVPAFAQLVTVKLSRDNHLLWKAQIVPILRGYQLLGFVDGTNVAPPRLIPALTEAGAEMVVNANHTAWIAQDQLLLAGILSTLSPEVLARVLLLTSSAAVWSALERMFSSQSRARIVQLKKQLALAQKNDSSMADYFGRVKAIADQLASAGHPISDDDAAIYILAGLDNSYNDFVTPVTLREDMSLDDLYAHLMDYELRHDVNANNYQISANSAGRGGRGRGSGHGGGRGYGNSGGRGQQQSYQGQGSQVHSNNRKNSGKTGVPVV